jgi:hypothetical protein
LARALGELGVSFDPYDQCPDAVPERGSSGSDVLAALMPEVNRALGERRDPRRFQRVIGKGPEFFYRYLLLTPQQRHVLEKAELMEFDGEPPGDDGEPDIASRLKRFFRLFTGD